MSWAEVRENFIPSPTSTPTYFSWSPLVENQVLRDSSKALSARLELVLIGTNSFNSSPVVCKV